MPKKKQALYCKQPDRDVPKLQCGHPLPCPHHTVTIHMKTKPPSLSQPMGSIIGPVAQLRLQQIMQALDEDT